jgi:HK97 family phage prohead protease
MSKSIIGEQSRTFRLERGEGSRYTAALSSELPVERWFGKEILSHSADAVNLERCERGLVLLFNHDVDRPIGRVQDVRLDGARLRGELTFGKRDDAQQIKQDVDDGMLGDVSIRYSIDEYEERATPTGDPSFLITRWTLLEASIVTVPADHTVGVGRSRATGATKEAINMTDETDTGSAGNAAAGNPTVVTELRGKRKADEDRGAQKAIKAERERIAELNDIFGSVDQRFRGEDFDSLRDKCIVDGIRPDGARKLLLDLIQGVLPEQTPSTRSVEDTVGGGRDPFVTAGRTDVEKMNEGIQRALEVRAGMITGEEARKEAGNEFSGRRIADLMRVWAQRNGIKVNYPTESAMIGGILNEGRRLIATGTSDFAGIVANVAGKALLSGWEEAPGTWRQWCRIGSVNDFRRVNRTGLSGMDILDQIPERAEYKYGDAKDRTEYLTASNYGKLFSISRAALLADDIGAFTTIPRRMGRAADLTVNKTVIDLLCSASGVGPTLNQDSTALFHANHNNYTATSGTPAVSTLEVGRSAMARQTDPNNGMPLNIQPKYLLVPSALKSTASILVASEKDPLGLASATGGATAPNPFYNQLTVISDPYLDDSSHTNGTVAWYLLADQNLHDTFEVAFVGGQQTPYMESRDGWTVDGVEYKVRVEFGVAALDYRGMYRKKGA